MTKKFKYTDAMQTNQSEKIPGKEHLMVENSTGGQVFALDDWKRLQRFLILGSDGPTYYTSARKLTRENAFVVLKCGKEDATKTVNTILNTSTEGLASSNDPALFALALLVSFGGEQKALALSALSQVARIPTHLFHFLQFAKDLNCGWGRSFKRAVANWYDKRELDKLSYALMKYKQRDGWSHTDVLKLAHPSGGREDSARNALYKWALDGTESELLNKQVLASLSLKGTTAKVAAKIVREAKLPHEVIPNELKNDPEIWAAILESMPLEAMIRNLAKMTSVGLLKPMSVAMKDVVNRLSNQELIQKARLHPISILKALNTYKKGHGDKGSLTWTPVAAIHDALDSAFYLAFKTVEPTGRNTGLFLDVSGSMSCPILGMNMSAIEASAAMALVTANVEKSYQLYGFSDRLRELDISPKMRIDDVLRVISGLPFAYTDCGLPFRYAMKEKLPIEQFVVYTDSETNAHTQEQPAVSLKKYRKQTGINATSAVVAMVSNGFSIADPTDPRSLDCVGFSTDTPKVLADFARGAL